MKDRFSKKKKEEPKKQSKADADFYRKQYESVDEGYSMRDIGLSPFFKKLNPMQRQAVSIALVMGGNMTGAVKAIEKIKKGLSKDKKVKNALKMANESMTEGQKKRASDILRKFDMAYIKFSQEVRDVMKLMDKSTGSKVDGKIINKAYGKHLIPFDDLMQSWAKGQQENPGLSEDD